MDNRKLELVTDFYEFTMSNGYFAKNMNNVNAYFDVFLEKFLMVAVMLYLLV